jgi:hypothetical protein|tara:strand:+ start:978 stop:1544 length:567 start_codon:yes stop_codon:yes gene_type:complete
MDQYVRLIKENIDVTDIQKDIDTFLTEFDFWHLDQISLTSHTGANDWSASIGKMDELEYPEFLYKRINKYFKGTSIEKLIFEYKEYYRWRLMKIDPRITYTVHKDGKNDPNIKNLRLHVPIITNPQAYLMFFDNPPEDTQTANVTYHNLKAGNIYEINTTNYHTAVNHGTNPRYHIVGVRYENSNNRT